MRFAEIIPHEAPVECDDQSPVEVQLLRQLTRIANTLEVISYRMGVIAGAMDHGGPIRK